MLVDVRSPNVQTTATVYAILDEESTSTFAHPRLIDKLNPRNKAKHNYSVRTVSELSSTPHEGRIARNLKVKGHREKVWHKLPDVFELHTIPDTKGEVCTSAHARAIPSLAPFADEFLPLHKTAEVMLLIGRDSDDLMATETLTKHVPIVHRTPLGTAAVGSPTPRGGTGRPRSLLTQRGLSAVRTFPDQGTRVGALPLEDPLFQTRPDDEVEDLSVEDREFLDHINSEIKINAEGRIEAPLPWRGKTEPLMPDNAFSALARQKHMLRDLEKDPAKWNFYLESMAKNLKNRYVERVPDNEVLTEQGRCWYLPTFVATNKRDKLRTVFDSAASFGPKGQEVSLNSQMLSGPDRTSRLRDVLYRFRENPVGFIADVESMFMQFHVSPQHRDYLRFWYWPQKADGSFDTDKPLVPYRARCHIFGNCGSPSVSNISFQTTTEWADPPPAPEVTRYIRESFYMDDGAGSAKDAATAISILQGARATLSQFGVRLHKITSHSDEVIRAFPESEVAKDVLEVLFEEDCLGMGTNQKCLGVAWCLRSDTLRVKVCVPDRPFTKRGILSVVNSVYDPLNICGPVTLAGRLFLRKILPRQGEDPEMYARGWDDPLPAEHQAWWDRYKARLGQLQQLSVPRCLIPPGFGTVVKQEILGFSDASQESTGYVLYARSRNAEGDIHVAFLSAGSKVAPSSATSIPRLELCAALQLALAIQDAKRALFRKPDHTTCYTDSRVVLGYLQNRERRFSKYVTRRVAAIANLETDWRFVGTADNVADLASRPTTPRALLRSPWLRGPDFIHQDEPQVLLEPAIPRAEDLPELVTETRVMTTRVKSAQGPLAHVFRTLAAKRTSQGLLDTIFEKHSSWQKAINIVTRMLDFIENSRKGKGPAGRPQLTAAEWLVREAQQATYPEVLSLLSKGKHLPEDHPLENLAPVLHLDVIRVGGRLDRAKLPYDRRHPLLVPKGHPAATLIISHYHRKTGHQGRHLTHGAIREGGFHLESGKALIKTFLSECVLCRRLRAKVAEQRMADLPLDRISSAAPFSHTALDVVGPWRITRGKATRSTPGEAKVWLLVASCLASRAVHVELLEGLDTSSLKNALARFVGIRGTVQLIRSDRGTNFIGAQSEDKDDVDVDELKRSLKSKGVEWIMNPPGGDHHMGGVWERLNASLKRVLEGTMSLMGPRKLSYDEFHTFVVEAASIVNGTPLWDVSSDPNDPAPLCPNMILTLREVPPGDPPTDFSEQDIISYGKKRWRRVQFLASAFWKRWHDMYITSLTKRNKWNRTKRNLAVGDLVMMREQAGPRHQWPLGRITSVRTSVDGLVRSCDVTVRRVSPGGVAKTFTYNRPIGEIIYLMSG